MPPNYDANTVPAILVSEVTHAFKNHQALNQVSFAVMPQTLHGFVGPNGAGKNDHSEGHLYVTETEFGPGPGLRSQRTFGSCHGAGKDRLYAGPLQHVSPDDGL